MTCSTCDVAVCRSSASRVSLNSRAFCSATPTLAAMRRQQALVVGAVHAFRLRALHADHAEARAADRDRHAQVRQRLLADDLGAELEAAPVRLAIDDERLARPDDPAGQALAELERLDLLAVLVREVDDAGVRVVQRDVGDVGLEHGADLLADEVEQRRQLELAGELLRHRVDRRELGGAPLRLGEQARVLDRDRRLQRQSDQEIELAVAERHARRSATPPSRP